MAAYGKTWWGEQWLRALDRIDFSNRLGRGRTYANTGKVLDININENIITAHVRGSRPKPYDINIVVPPFFEKDQKILLEGIKKNPLLVSQLLNRQLPNEILTLAEKNNIKIFPHSWQDIKLNCSCPDFAVPCKHLAAVIYMIANEIDKNPFLIFTLHRMNVLESLQSMHTDMALHENEKIISSKDLIDESNKKVNTVQPLDTKSLESPDFSLIEDLSNTIPHLFTANPLFYTDADFKTLIQSHYKRQKRNEENYYNNLKTLPEALNTEYRYYNYQILIDNEGNARLIAFDFNGLTHELYFDDFINLLAKTEKKHLDLYSASFGALYRSFRFCNFLAQKSATLPRLFQASKSEYQIQWLPALINNSVRSVFDQLLKWLPSGMVVAEISSGVKKIKTTILPLMQEDALVFICSLFLNESVKDAYDQLSDSSKGGSELGIKIKELFFNDTIHTFSSFTEKEIPNTIQLWLNRFHLSQKSYSPVLQVREIIESKQFSLEILMQNKTNALYTMEPLDTFLLTAGKEKFGALKDIHLLSEYLPEISVILESAGKNTVRYDNQTFAEVLTGILPLLKLFGVQILLPKSLQQLLYPKVSVSLKPKNKGAQFFSLDSLIDFDWQIAIGDQFLSKEDFIKLSKSTSGLVRIRDQYMMLEKNDLEKIIKRLESPKIPNGLLLFQAALSGDFEGAPINIDEKLKAEINKILQEERAKVPQKINAILRPYQERGYAWMYKNLKLGLGSVLADDMGLGKTLQVITLIQKLKDDKALISQPVLVIAPTTLLNNWQREINRFAPELNLMIFHGSNRKPNFNGLDVIITTYGMARSENKTLSKQSWSLLIIDEAQNIKNTETGQTKAVKSIPAKAKVAMSGTPVENRLLEYWSIFDFANPGYLGNANWFEEEYSIPIELNQDKKRLNKFKSITTPFIMRRVKTDKNVIQDLPDKIENNQYCQLSKEQAALYENMTKDLLSSVESADGINRRGIILKLLTTLKQICNHPANYLKTKDNNHPDQSGKSMMLLQLLETIYENNEKVLIFSQYMEMGTILRQMIHDHFGKKALQLHGGCSRKERDEMVQSFQHKPLYDTFILSLKAGGTGLNLTAANHVIHYDLWWNPAVEAQATDRAFRIGQSKNVMVHRLISKGTLEEKIDDMLKAKKALANLTVSTGEKWIGELSDKELRELVVLNK